MSRVIFHGEAIVRLGASMPPMATLNGLVTADGGLSQRLSRSMDSATTPPVKATFCSGFLPLLSAAPITRIHLLEPSRMWKRVVLELEPMSISGGGSRGRIL